ncbi:MAG: hypothetical protein IJW63_11920 [Lachnospiraceae bacterium]|nr:hypothetical protein [Lachnospiraceae bacterium]
MGEYLDGYDGFDGRETVYDAKAEKKYESTIWKVLLVVGLIVFVVATALTVENIQLYLNGNTIEGTYDEVKSSVVVHVEGGPDRYIYIDGGIKQKLVDGKATLYYAGENFLQARELLEPGFYFMAYGVAVVLVTGSGLMLRKIYKK